MKQQPPLLQVVVKLFGASFTKLAAVVFQLKLVNQLYPSARGEQRFKQAELASFDIYFDANEVINAEPFLLEPCSKVYLRYRASCPSQDVLFSAACCETWPPYYPAANVTYELATPAAAA